MKPMIMPFTSFLRDNRGAVTILFVILFPLLLLIGGLATDVSLLNAQKRYVQSQADLAAQSAARYLPDAAEVRTVARAVVTRNARYGEITLADAQIVLGRYDPADGSFLPDPDQAHPANASAVRVVVPSPFSPLLLKPVLADENIVIRRDAVATQDAAMVFSLRNALLGVDTSASVLDPLLADILGLELSASVAGYRGLADAEVRLDNLLGLGAEALNLGINAGVVTFNDVLDVPIQLSSLLGIDPLGLLLSPLGSGSAPATVRLGDLLQLSPGLAQAHVGDVLPDVSINAFDLVTAFLGLAGAALPDEHRLDVGIGLNLGPLANLGLSVGLLSQPVTVVARMSDSPLPMATIEQANVALVADVLNLSAAGGPKLIGLELGLDAIIAEARPVALYCGATGDQPLAQFTVTPRLAGLSLELGILKSAAETDDILRANPLLGLLRGLLMISIEAGTDSALTLVGTPQQVTITAQQYQDGTAIAVSLDSLVTPLAASLRDLISDLEVKVVLLGGSLGILNSLLNLVLSLVTSVVLVPLQLVLGPLVDAIVMGLLDALGVQVLPAELILQDYSCAGTLVH